MSTDGQSSLFELTEQNGIPERAHRTGPPARGKGRPRSAAGHPAVALDVLTELDEHRYGLLEDGDRVVIFEDHDRVRIALDEDTVCHLLAQGHAERCPAREVHPCRHGVVSKSVCPLRLTKRGRALLARWSALQPLNDRR